MGGTNHSNDFLPLYSLIPSLIKSLPFAIDRYQHHMCFGGPKRGEEDHLFRKKK